MKRNSLSEFNSLRRASMLYNEDDYDYAIELWPDDEYRQAAEHLPGIFDFDEIDFDNLNKQEIEDIEKGFESNASENRRMSRFDEIMTDIHKIDEASDDFSKNVNNNFEPENVDFGFQFPYESPNKSIEMIERNDRNSSIVHTLTGMGTANQQSRNHEYDQYVSKNEFFSRLNLLNNHKKWVEKAARRSSIGFQRHHFATDKEAMDNFLVLMSRGIHIRRHQSNKMAEVVRLFSTDGCQTIQWEKPKAKELLVQRKIQGKHSEGRTSAIYNTNYDKSAFDYCITICGCGDDLIMGNNANQSEVINTQTEKDEQHYLGFGRCCYNLGYRRFGSFKDLNIIAVHPSQKEDPTEKGMLGTLTLRKSKDTFNPALTFSIIIEDMSTRGFTSLDIECETENAYFTLLKGFKTIQEDSATRRQANLQEAKSFKQRFDQLVCLWNSTRAIFFPSSSSILGHNQENVSNDPTSALFAPSKYVDVLRAWKVGGGLIPANHFRNTFSPGADSNPNLSRSPSPQKSKPIQLPVAQFLGWKSAGTQIWARLKMAGLDVKCVLSWDLTRVILKIRCPNWRLEEMAEQMHLKIKSRDGYLKQFKVSKRDSFVPLGANGAIFRSSERQQIIDFILRSKIKDGGAELDENTELGKQIVQRFPLHMYSRLMDIRHTWVTFWRRETPGTTPEPWSPFSVSYRTTYERSKESIGFFFDNILNQPLDSIAEYFGENIAFYFAFLAFYSRWLFFPSVVGVIVFAYQMTSHQLDNWLCIPYSVMLMIWISFLLAFWRQKASALAYRWGVLDFEVGETERPQFKGKYMYDESTGEIRKTYSLWKRLAKYLVSMPSIFLAIFATLVVISVVFYSQDVISNDYANGRSISLAPSFPSFSYGHPNSAYSTNPSSPSSTSWNSSNSAGSPGMNNSSDSSVPSSSGSNSGWTQMVTLDQLTSSSFWAATFFYPSLYGILVSIFTKLFYFIATWLNDFENHRTQTIYINRLILKVFSFHFVAIFTSLYYYAFFLKDAEGAYTRICITILSLMTVGQWWSLLLDIWFPSILHKTLMYRMKSNYAFINRRVYNAKEIAEEKASNKSLREKLDKRVLYLNQAKSQCWEEALKSKYDNISDYSYLVIQIGFIIFFGSVFPLAPLIALLNNILLIRFNALKICHTRQRPIAQKIGGIGVWEDVLQLMSVGGIITNCALIGFTSSKVRNFAIPKIGSTGFAIALFVYEQVLLLFKYWLHASIPRIPPSVQRAQSRERKSLDRKSFIRRKEQLEKEKMNQLFKKKKHSSIGMFPFWNFQSPNKYDQPPHDDSDQDSDGDLGGGMMLVSGAKSGGSGYPSPMIVDNPPMNEHSPATRHSIENFVPNIIPFGAAAMDQPENLYEQFVPFDPYEIEEKEDPESDEDSTEETTDLDPNYSQPMIFGYDLEFRQSSPIPWSQAENDLYDKNVDRSPLNEDVDQESLVGWSVMPTGDDEGEDLTDPSLKDFTKDHNKNLSEAPRQESPDISRQTLQQSKFDNLASKVESIENHLISMHQMPQVSRFNSPPPNSTKSKSKFHFYLPSKVFGNSPNPRTLSPNKRSHKGLNIAPLSTVSKSPSRICTSTRKQPDSYDIYKNRSNGQKSKYQNEGLQRTENPIKSKMINSNKSPHRSFPKRLDISDQYVAETNGNRDATNYTNHAPQGGWNIIRHRFAPAKSPFSFIDNQENESGRGNIPYEGPSHSQHISEASALQSNHHYATTKDKGNQTPIKHTSSSHQTRTAFSPATMKVFQNSLPAKNPYTYVLSSPESETLVNNSVPQQVQRNQLKSFKSPPQRFQPTHRPSTPSNGKMRRILSVQGGADTPSNSATANGRKPPSSHKTSSLQSSNQTLSNAFANPFLFASSKPKRIEFD